MRRGRGDDGAVLLEFALVMPLLFMMFFGMADIGLSELGDAVGSSGARDGARRGILDYESAHDPGAATGNYDKIANAVKERLVGMVLGNPTITVRCLHADLTQVDGTGTCDPTKVVVPGDLIKVSVTWRHITATPFLSNAPTTDSAVMKIVGRPDTSGGSTGGVCALSSPSATPSTVNLSGTQLASAVVLRVTVSSLTDCGAPLVTLPIESGITGAQTMTPESGNTFAYTLAASTGPWTSGLKTSQFSVLAGSAANSVGFTVSGAAPACTVSITQSPDITLKNNGSTENDVTYTASITSIAACGAVNLIITPASSGGRHTSPGEAMSCAGTSCSLTIPKNESPWTIGQKQVQVSAANGGSDSRPITVS